MTGVDAPSPSVIKRLELAPVKPPVKRLSISRNRSSVFVRLRQGLTDQHRRPVPDNQAAGGDYRGVNNGCRDTGFESLALVNFLHSEINNL